MNLIRLLGFVFLLSGCGWHQLLVLDEENAALERPISIVLEDASGNPLGSGIPLKLGVFVAPDHLWQVSQSLYYNDLPVKVLARDFRHDLFFFTLENQIFTSFPEWSSTPPGVGQMLAWEDFGLLQQAPVFSAKADFELGNIKVQDLMQLSTVTNPGNSGKVLFDPDNFIIYGMLIASDSFKDVSYFVRSDIILELAREYLSNS